MPNKLSNELSNQPTDGQPGERAVVRKASMLSSIWFIPILALILGAYMVVYSWVSEGPEIEIAFSTADGLEPGKTKVKYRNVDMGVVHKVRLNDNFDGVIATAKLDKQATPLLREDTRFWVVTASVAVGRITGLDTLLSGAYIQMAPGIAEEGWRNFVALDEPPLTPTDADGLRLQLTSPEASSVSTGDAVLHRGFKVGRVESTKFDPESRLVRYVIFVDAPYHELVDSSVRFWDVSGMSITATADGVEVDSGSLDTVLLGGIAFGTPPGVRAGDPVQHNAEFKLYDSYDDILKNPFTFGTHFVVSFRQSIKGLQPGAPVEYRGIPIGRVERLLLKESMVDGLAAGFQGQGNPVPVLIYLEPARLAMPDRESSITALRTAIENGVADGMRASVEYASLITGAKFISLDYYQDVEPDTLGTFLDYGMIPTIETGLDQLQDEMASILNMFSSLPLDDTIANANAVIANLSQTLYSLNGILDSRGAQNLPQEMEQTLRELRTTLEGLSPGSEIYQGLGSGILRLNRALDNIESLTNTLSEKPNAVLLPTETPADPIPEARK